MCAKAADSAASRNSSLTNKIRLPDEALAAQAHEIERINKAAAASNNINSGDDGTSRKRRNAWKTMSELRGRILDHATFIFNKTYQLSSKDKL